MINTKKLKLYLETEEGKRGIKEYFNDLAKREKIAENRYVRFEKWLKNNNFNKLMQRLVVENGKEWSEKCYHKGYQPYPNNKLSFIIKYVTNKYSHINVPQLKSKYYFPNQIWFFKGYFFKMTWGQGVLTEVFDKDFKQIIAL